VIVYVKRSADQRVPASVAGDCLDTVPRVPVDDDARAGFRVESVQRVVMLLVDNHEIATLVCSLHVMNQG
jgi:hypothetical protein